MTDPYEHLRTPSAYDDMIRALLAAKEAVERNADATHGNEWGSLSDAQGLIEDAIRCVGHAHHWDGDEPRT